MFYLDYTIVESRMFTHLFYLILLHFKKKIRMKNIILIVENFYQRIFFIRTKFVYDYFEFKVILLQSNKDCNSLLLYYCIEVKNKIF